MNRVLPLAFLVLLVLPSNVARAADGDAEVRLGRATFRAGNPGRALEYFQQAAAKGNAEGMYFIGLLLEGGKGIDADLPKAAAWHRQAAEKGHTDSMNHLANLLRRGAGVEKNEAEAFAWCLKSAQAGDAHGIENVAESYYDGTGTAKDPAKAAEWYRKAVSNGSTPAMVTYGYMLSHGQGVPQDLAAAFALYLKAARAGDAAAMFNIGEYYRIGKGVAQNSTAARFWYLRAAMSGDPDAEAKVAALREAPTENAEGAALMALAERIRNASKTDAEMKAHDVENFPKMIEAAELGHLPAIAFLVYAYQDGRGTSKDPVKAREWAQIAAEMGNDASQTMLAQYMLKGIGGPRNSQGARFWFEKGALAGNSLSMNFLASIYDGDYGLPPNEALARYWWIEAYKKGSPTAEKVLKERGLLKPDPRAQAFIDRIHRDGPDTSSVQAFTWDVAQYCNFDGPRCHELSVAALKFQRAHNAAAEAANMARLWNNAGNDAGADAKWRERSDCMKKKTDSIQKHTYGEQDWYYSGSCY